MMNWSIRYATKTIELPKELFPIQDDRYNGTAWNLVESKTSSSPTPARQRGEVSPVKNGTPLHALVPKFIIMIDNGPGEASRMREFFHPQRVLNHMADTLKPAMNKPNSLIKVYRTVPRHVDTIHHGDQVTTDPYRAMQIAVREDGYRKDPPHTKSIHILTSMVPAKHLISAIGTGIQNDKYDPDHISRWSAYRYNQGGHE